MNHCYFLIQLGAFFTVIYCDSLILSSRLITVIHCRFEQKITVNLLYTFTVNHGYSPRSRFWQNFAKLLLTMIHNDLQWNCLTVIIGYSLWKYVWFSQWIRVNGCVWFWQWFTVVTVKIFHRSLSLSLSYSIISHWFCLHSASLDSIPPGLSVAKVAKQNDLYFIPK